MAHRILIADGNSATCAQMAESFLRSGYQVEITASAADVVNKVMQKQAALVLLGENFNERVPVTDLVRILRNCDRALDIILVTDQVSACQERSVRQEGIFYHALRPNSNEDTEEIRLAVECAFNRTAPSTLGSSPGYRLN